MCMVGREITITILPRVFSQLHRVSCIVQVVLTFIWVGPIALMVFGADTVVASSERIIEPLSSIDEINRLFRNISRRDWYKHKSG